VVAEDVQPEEIVMRTSPKLADEKGVPSSSSSPRTTSVTPPA